MKYEKNEQICIRTVDRMRIADRMYSVENGRMS